MKPLLSFFFSLVCSLTGFAQKAVIDTSVLARPWPWVGQPGLSTNGQYLYYTINEQPAGSHTLVVRSAEGTWQKNIPASNAVCFSADSHQFVYQAADSLIILHLGMDHNEFIQGVSNVRQSKKNQGHWLAWQLKNDPNQTLVLRNLINDREQRFAAVNDYQFDESGRVLLLKTTTTHDSSAGNHLVWVDLAAGTAITIWTSATGVVGICRFDTAGRQLAFLVKERGAVPDNTLWYYKTGRDKALLKIDSHSPDMPPGWGMDNHYVDFNTTGNYLLCRMVPREDRKPNPAMAKVDIWNYQDDLLQSQQLKNPGAHPYTAVVNVDDSRVVRLEQQQKESVALVTASRAVVWAPGQYWQMETSRLWLVTLQTGIRTLIATGFLAGFSVSPDERWLVYFNCKKGQYYGYDIQSGNTRTMTTTLTTYLRNDTRASVYHGTFGTAGWWADGSRLLAYDAYDIWALDPAGIQPPLNITHGYGRLHHIQFRFKDPLQKIFRKDIPLLLTALDTKNLSNGLYQLMAKNNSNPQPLVPCMPYKFSFLPAADDHTWLMQRQSATEAPNYFLTHDLKTYQRLTNLQPQQSYHWLTEELVHFTLPDGRPSLGILYQPDNLDPHKKYPVLFNYYETKSDRLHDFLYPGFTGDNINIPWFVSQGYLVFTPDIHYTVGKTGQSACEALVAAAQYLARRPYVDAAHMGIEGHSFGGFETNYIVTHSSLFRAACSASGATNMISSYGSFWGDGSSKAAHTEDGQGNMGGAPWQQLPAYLDNSPVLHADKVTTPLLLMANKKDDAVEYSQGLAFFIGLRRLNKKAWLLQYDDGEHSVGGKSAVDFTLRMTQFFDHYLKGTPPPVWMTQGIPARLKGIETGLNLDNSGQQP